MAGLGLIVQGMLVDFQNKFCEIENDVNSVANLKTQTQPKWITTEILDLMLRRDFEKKGNNHTEYKNLRNKCKLLIQQSKTTFYKEIIVKCENDLEKIVAGFNELGV